MIILVCALYGEGKPFIQLLNLKKDYKSKSFQLFKNSEYTLIISGTGPINAAAATSYALTASLDSQGPKLILNFGCCAANSTEFDIGDIVLINSISDRSTGHKFYPDLLWKWPFEEAAVETVTKVVTDQIESECPLIDMEAAGFFQAASHFLSPHQIQLVKVVLDKTWEKQKACAELPAIMEQAAPKTIEWLENIHLDSLDPKIFSLTANKEKLLALLHKKLKLSSAMYIELKRLITASPISEKQIEDFINTYSKISVHHKREGKFYYKRLLGEFSKI